MARGKVKQKNDRENFCPTELRDVVVRLQYMITKGRTT